MKSFSIIVVALIVCYSACEKRYEIRSENSSKKQDNLKHLDGNAKDGRGHRALKSDCEKSLNDSTSDILAKLSQSGYIESQNNYQEACLLVLELARRDPELAIDLIPSMPSALQILLTQGSVATYLSGLSEDKLTNFFEHPTEKNRGLIIGLAIDILNKVASSDPDKAVRILAKDSSKSWSMLLANTMLVIASSDVDRALKLTKEYLRDDQLSVAYSSIIDRCAVDSPDKSLDLIQLYLSGPKAVGCYAKILKSAMERDPSSAMDLLDKVPSQNLTALLSSSGFVESLIKCSPQKAVQTIDLIVFTEDTKAIYSRAALCIGETDMSSALSFVQSLPDGSGSRQILGQLFENLAKNNPDDAMKYAMGLEGERQNYAIRGVVKVLANEDYSKSLILASTASPIVQQDLYREIARAVTYSRPDQAVSILEDSSMSAKLGIGFRSEMLNNTVQTWAKQDLKSAQTWVEKLPEQDLPKGVQGLMTTWMKSDPVAASAWLVKLPPGAARDAGAQEVIRQVKNTDPEMAEQWRKSLTPSAPK